MMLKQDAGVWENSEATASQIMIAVASMVAEISQHDSFYAG